MKKYILTAFAALSTLIVSAQTTVVHTDSITTISNPGDVIISETVKGVSVNVKDKEGKTTVYSYKNTYGENSTIITEQEENNDFAFSVPFISDRKKTDKTTDKITGKIKESKCRWNVESTGLMFGVNAMLSTPDAMKGYRSAGTEFLWSNIIGVKYRPFRNGLAFSLGFGIQWSEDRLHNGLRFNRGDDKQSTVLEKFPENSSETSSCLHTFSLLVPFKVKYEFASGWDIGVGVWGNFTTHACEWGNYSLDDIEYEDSWDSVRRRVFRLNYIANVSYKSIGLYVKYTPKNAISEGYGPQYRSLSAGISIGF